MGSYYIENANSSSVDFDFSRTPQVSYSEMLEKNIKKNYEKRQHLNSEKSIRKTLEYAETIPSFLETSSLEKREKKEKDVAINQQIAQMGQKIAHLEESSKKALKKASHTSTLSDDIFAHSLKGKIGEKLVNDLSVTLDMIDNPLSSFGFDFGD